MGRGRLGDEEMVESFFSCLVLFFPSVASPAEIMSRGPQGTAIELS